MGRLGLPLLLLAFAGCVTTTSEVQSRFATEQGCPRDQVTVDLEGGALYRVRGCDKETTYACSAVAAFHGGVQCVERGLPNPPGYHEQDRPTLPPPDPKVPAPH